VADAAEIEQEFQMLSGELRKLEAEYNMYFAGRTPRPPVESRGRLDLLFKRWDRRPMDTAASRFRLQTLQSRYSSFADLWDRALRAREEGRPSSLYRPRESAVSPTASKTASPHATAETNDGASTGAGEAGGDAADSGSQGEFGPGPSAPAVGTDGPRAVTFSDPREESDKLQALYDLLMDARSQAGQGNVPFHKFADLVTEQTQRLKSKGLDEVTFSVTTTDGRVNLTAKGSKPGS
jgi:hypothetical protein